MNTVRKKQLGDARKTLASAERNDTTYPLSQAPSLMCVLVQSLGREENTTKEEDSKKKRKLFLILDDDKACFSLS